MKKIYSIVLMATALLIHGHVAQTLYGRACNMIVLPIPPPAKHYIKFIVKHGQIMIGCQSIKSNANMMSRSEYLFSNNLIGCQAIGKVAIAMSIVMTSKEDR